MLKSLQKACVFYITIATLLSACGFNRATPAATQMDASAALTAAAGTAQARLTQLYQSTPSPAPATPAPQTTTPALTSQAPTLQVTNAVTSTQNISATLPAATATSGPTTGAPSGDKAQFVIDLSIPDGTVVAPDASFKKTWKVKNIGTTTWSTSYTLVHVSQDPLQGPKSVAMPKEVVPGDTVDISVELTAPSENGKYTSYWNFGNAQGKLFGDQIYVQIVVGEPGETPEVTGTPGGTGGAIVTMVSASIDNATTTEQCPYTYAITVLFTLSKDADVTYQLEAGSDDPNFKFNLPGPQTYHFTAGTQTLTINLKFTDSGSGWVKFHITSPENVSSKKANFSLTCQK
ncbi:MAG: NBR1-Ig-like domain-containing protein [Omnitrophica WOR_2 bacterium]